MHDNMDPEEEEIDVYKVRLERKTLVGNSPACHKTYELCATAVRKGVYPNTSFTSNALVTLAPGIL